MQRHPDKREQCKFDTKGFNLHIGSQGWHYGIGDNFVSANDDLSRTTLTMTSSNQLHSQPRGQNSEIPDSGSIIFIIEFSLNMCPITNHPKRLFNDLDVYKFIEYKYFVGAVLQYTYKGIMK